MARRRSSDNAEVIAKGCAIVVALFILAGGGKSGITAWIGSAVSMVLLALVLIVGTLVVYRLWRWFHGARLIPEGERFKTPGCPVPSVPSAPRTTPEAAGGVGTIPAVNLLERLRGIDWYQFEKVVGVACASLGYAVTKRGGANPDGGIDLILVKDGKVYGVQCKQWKTWNVGVKPVREFLGALTDARIENGIFVTLCGYTEAAKELAQKHGIEIIDERGMGQILESIGGAFNPEIQAILSDTRKICPKCESEMVRRTAAEGRSLGERFWGCSSYPRCRFIMPAERTGPGSHPF